MDSNPFYTLTDSRNYTLQKLFKARGLDPLDAMRSIAVTCNEQAGMQPHLRFPSSTVKGEIAKKFATSSSTAKATAMQSYLAGYNACIRHMEELFSHDNVLDAYAKHRVMHPIDMTLREMAFAARALEVDFWFLVKEIAGETSPDSDIMQRVKNWKREYSIEQERHEETRKQSAQRADEIAGCRRIIAQLRDTLHREGLQDPTLQVVRSQ